MKKKLLSLLCAAVLCACLCLSASAAPALLIDDADLLTSGEETELLARLEDIRAAFSVDVVIDTADTLYGSSPRSYADDKLDNGGYAPDAILLLVSMETRDVYVSTCGRAIYAFSDRALDDLLDQVIYYLSAGDFNSAFRIYAELCDSYLTRYETGDTSPLPTGARFDATRALAVSLVIGSIAALCVTLIMKGKLRSVRKKHTAAEFVIPGSLIVTHSRDMFLYRHVSRHAKPQQKSGSSTHFSSGGISHGGGGRRF